MMTTSGSEEKNFLGVAVAAIPRVTEIIAAYPAEYRSGALETAERCYMEAAREFGCTLASCPGTVGTGLLHWPGPRPSVVGTAAAVDL